MESHINFTKKRTGEPTAGKPHGGFDVARIGNGKEKYFVTHRYETLPIKPEDHYFVPLSTRLNEQELRQLIEQKKYFILHAPRQTGKTSTMINFAKQLNAEGNYTALYVNIEGAQAARGKVDMGMAIIIQEFATRVTEQLPTQPALNEIFEGLKKKQFLPEVC